MGTNKSDAIKKILSQKEPNMTEITFFLNEVADCIIHLTKTKSLSWMPYSEFLNNHSSIPKRLKSIIDIQMEDGLVFSQENSFFVEHRNNFYISAYYKRIGTERITFGFIVISSLPSNDNGVGMVNSERAMRLNNLIRYNMTATKSTKDEQQLNYIRSVFESLKNEQPS